ncbi:MAG: hypothetical protein HY525_19885 [Betaproteobacteria bacterium]|nr:hypothetical protein [Betaproteobacteria bacterium]
MPKAIEVGTGARWLRPRRHAFEQATYNLDEALLVRRAVDHEFLKSFRRIERHVLTAFTRVSNLPPGRLDANLLQTRSFGPEYKAKSMVSRFTGSSKPDGQGVAQGPLSV